AQRVIESVRRDHWLELEQLGTSLRAACTLHMPMGNRLMRGASRILDRCLGVSHRRGLSVALLGPDGAGKSTLAEGIKHTFIFPVHVTYMGLTDGHLPLVDRLRVPGLVLAGRLCIFWCRYLMARYHQVRGRLVVFDRYI